MKCGLLGEKLGHSYSPEIHRQLGDYEYGLYEVEPERLEDFLKTTDLDGMNVTIPYKIRVMELCGSLSAEAEEIGSVNTLVRQADGSWRGHNTDMYGFMGMLRSAGIDVKGRKTLVLGSGGASRAVKAGLKMLGSRETVIISRSGEDNYGNLFRHRDAEIIVNTTPLGMYPRNGEAAVDLRDFPDCAGVADIVYNPQRTALLLQAEELGIPRAGGLYMLTAQAKKAAELFTGSPIDDGRTEDIYRKLSGQMKNIALIGMPGAGKSSVAAEISARTGRKLYDLDAEIEMREGRSIPAVFAAEGEAYFRNVETEVLRDISRLSGCVISCGGGIVLRKENYGLLHQNSDIVWIRRSLEGLSTEGRPISLSRPLEEIYGERKQLYEDFADVTVENEESPEAAAKAVLERLAHNDRPGETRREE